MRIFLYCIYVQSYCSFEIWFLYIVLNSEDLLFFQSINTRCMSRGSARAGRANIFAAHIIGQVSWGGDCLDIVYYIYMFYTIPCTLIFSFPILPLFPSPCRSYGICMGERCILSTSNGKKSPIVVDPNSQNAGGLCSQADVVYLQVTLCDPHLSA